MKNFAALLILFGVAYWIALKSLSFVGLGSGSLATDETRPTPTSLIDSRGGGRQNHTRGDVEHAIADADPSKPFQCNADIAAQAMRLAPHEARVLAAAHYLPEDGTHYSMLDREMLDALVAQGDTAAMVALAKLDSYAAQGFGENANWPARQQLSSASPPFSLSSEEQENRWKRALEGYYRAALSGRTMALIAYGRTLAAMNKTAVDLGWIGQAEFDALSDVERRALSPNMLYLELARRLAPEAFNWAMQPMVPQFPDDLFDDRHQGILDQEALAFFARLEASGQDVPESILGSFPVYSELIDRSCTSSYPYW